MIYLGLLIATCAVLIAAALDYLRNRKRFKMLGTLPGFRPRAIIGNLRLRYLFTSMDVRSLNSLFCLARFGVAEIFSEEGLYVYWIGRRPIVVLTRAETAEVVLSSSVLIDKSDFYKLGSEWIGNGLANSTGDIWRHDRKQLTPAFHFRILEDFLPIMNEQASILVQKLKEDALGQPWVDLQEHARLCALDTILETSMGIRAEAQKRKSLYTTLVQSITTSLLERAFRPWLHPNFIYFLTPASREYLRLATKLNDMTDKIIEKRRRARPQTEAVHSTVEDSVGRPIKKRLALLDLLLDAGLDKKQLRDQVSTFVFAGHHTLSMSLVWVLYALGLYPEVQDKLAEEVDQVLGQDLTREVTQDDLKKLKYMSRVMKETQRACPSAPIIARKLAEDTKIGGHVIPAGTDCAIAIACIHRDRKAFPEPELFDPDRFLPENSVGRHPHAFIPFSAGPRNCIGQRYSEMQLKVALCHLIRAFRFRSLDPQDKIKVILEINLRPLHPLRTEVTARNSNSTPNTEVTAL